VGIKRKRKGDSNAGTSRVAEYKTHKVSERDFEHFLTSEQHADGTKGLATYDFLLVIYGDLRSRCNCCEL